MGAAFYFTTRLRRMDEQFYPDGVGNWMVNSTHREGGVGSVRSKIFLETKEYRLHQIGWKRRRSSIRIAFLKRKARSAVCEWERPRSGVDERYLALDVLSDWERSMESIPGWGGCLPFASGFRNAGAKLCGRAAANCTGPRFVGGVGVALIAVLRANLQPHTLKYFAAAVLIF